MNKCSQTTPGHQILVAPQHPSDILPSTGTCALAQLCAAPVRKADRNGKATHAPARPYTCAPPHWRRCFGHSGFRSPGSHGAVGARKAHQGIDRQRARGNSPVVHLSYGGLGARMGWGAAGYTGSYDRSPRGLPDHVGGTCRHCDESQTLGGLAHGGVR